MDIKKDKDTDMIRGEEKSFFFVLSRVFKIP